MKLTILLAVAALAVPAAARAQTQTGTGVIDTTELPPTAYTTERDSPQRRATRVRTLTELCIAEFHSSFAALAGTSRRIKSYVRRQARNTAAAAPGYQLVKKEITKHKTHGADVTKVYYYDLSGRLLLAELYQQNQLARQRLYEYLVQRDGKAFFQPFRSTEWVRGDYLSLRVRATAATDGRVQRYYFTALRRPE